METARRVEGQPASECIPKWLDGFLGPESSILLNEILNDPSWTRIDEINSNQELPPAARTQLLAENPEFHLLRHEASDLAESVFKEKILPSLREGVARMLSSTTLSGGRSLKARGRRRSKKNKRKVSKSMPNITMEDFINDYIHQPFISAVKIGRKSEFTGVNPESVRHQILDLISYQLISRLLKFIVDNGDSDPRMKRIMVLLAVDLNGTEYESTFRRVRAIEMSVLLARMFNFIGNDEDNLEALESENYEKVFKVNELSRNKHFDQIEILLPDILQEDTKVFLRDFPPGDSLRASHIAHLIVEHRRSSCHYLLDRSTGRINYSLSSIRLGELGLSELEVAQIESAVLDLLLRIYDRKNDNIPSFSLPTDAPSEHDVKKDIEAVSEEVVREEVVEVFEKSEEEVLARQPNYRKALKQLLKTRETTEIRKVLKKVFGDPSRPRGGSSHEQYQREGCELVVTLAWHGKKKSRNFVHQLLRPIEQMGMTEEVLRKFKGHQRIIAQHTA